MPVINVAMQQFMRAWSEDVQQYADVLERACARIEQHDIDGATALLRGHIIARKSRALPVIPGYAGGE